MDSAKAISVKVSQSGPLTEYENMVGGKAKIVPPLPPIICIPTSAGTGSETNQYAVITDKERKLKFTLMSDHMIPKLSIIDPELTKTMPPAITASTGIDALAHCIEGYVGLASKYHPYYEALALYGVKLIGRSLVNAYKNSLDLSARRDMSMAAAFGGICFTKGLGLGHAIGHAIGAYHHIPHGSACAIGLLIFVKANEEMCKEEFQDLAWALSRTDDLLTALKGLYAVLEMPNSFSEMGIKRNDLDEIAYETYINAVNLAANPKSLSEKQIYELIQSSY
jgi:alcohol dehydrogenase class IV